MHYLICSLQMSKWSCVKHHFYITYRKPETSARHHVQKESILTSYQKQTVGMLTLLCDLNITMQLHKAFHRMRAETDISTLLLIRKKIRIFKQ